MCVLLFVLVQDLVSLVRSYEKISCSQLAQISNYRSSRSELIFVMDAISSWDFLAICGIISNNSVKRDTYGGH